jgi:hypothetical protein
MNRRGFLTAIMVAAVAGCATSSGDVPATVASDAALIASGLAGAFKNIPAVPSNVPAALADLATAAQALDAADTASAARPLVERIITDVAAVVTATAGMPLPAPIAEALAAAQVLLPVIEAAVGMIANATAEHVGMTPGEARLILRAAARPDEGRHHPRCAGDGS